MEEKLVRELIFLSIVKKIVLKLLKITLKYERKKLPYKSKTSERTSKEKNNIYIYIIKISYLYSYEY